MNRGVRSLLLVGGAYVAAQMMADIASLRIIEIGGQAVDAGTLIYPFTFTLRDLVHKIAGKSAARTLIFLAAGINVFMAAFFWLVSRLPPDQVTGPQLEFGVVLAPVWGIVVASIIAEIASELIDTEAYSRWVARFGEDKAVGSGPVQQRDSHTGRLGCLRRAWRPCSGSSHRRWRGRSSWVNVVLKALITVISIPWIYWVRPEPLAATYTQNGR